MAISPIEQFGTIGRTQDFSIIKQQEDAKGMIDQSNILTQVEKNANDKMTQVHQADHTEMMNKKFDAKEKGDNEYYGNGGQQRKKGQKQEGKVILKSTSSFDIKI